MGETRTKSRFLPQVMDSGFFVLRTPLMPVEELLRWGSGLKSAETLEKAAEPAQGEASWADDVAVLRARLREVLGRAEVEQALYIASPSLRTGIEHWKRDPDSKKGLQAERAIVRYFARMCVRCTPFGVFSGCSVGRTGRQVAQTILELGPLSAYRSSTRLDFDYLGALAAELRKDPALAQALKYWPNSSLRRIGDAWHYVESRQSGSRRSHHLVGIEDDPFLRAALERAQEGATTAELRSAVLFALGDPEPSDHAEVADFVAELLESQVLVSTLEPLITGPPPVDDLIHQLEDLAPGHAAAAVLRQARDQMQALDQRALGCSPDEYAAIAEGLQALPGKPNTLNVFQVDMFKPVRNAQLAASVLDDLGDAIEVLCRLGKSEESEDLTSFRDAFVARYDRALVPLLEALDDEAGIGFGRTAPADASPLLRTLRLPNGGLRPGGSESQSILLRQLLRMNQATDEISLDPADLPQPRQSAGTLPTAFCVAATLVAKSQEALDEGRFELYWRGTFGPSGARLLGRFCHGDPELERGVRVHLQLEEEQDPNAIYAELVYAPEGRVGNVLCRPVLREYEIPYLGRSGAPTERQLPVSDLLVGVDRGSVVIFSRRLGKRVVPRLSNAHGFVNPKLAAVYRFLTFLQNQQARIPGFSWGSLMSSLDFLPRVRVGRVILSVARWRLSKAEITSVALPTRYGSFAAVQALRRRRGMPQWILLEESDNTLPVDLNNPLSVDALVHVLKRVSSATITEMYPAPDQQCASGPEGRYCHELNVPFNFVREKDETSAGALSKRSSLALANALVRGAARSLAPGGDWLYAKIYAGPGIQDELLTGVIHQVVAQATAAGAIRCWFFIRYGDPHDHLRVRFCGDPQRLRGEVLPALSDAIQPLIRSGRVWSLEFHTYVREIERYGGLGGTLIAEDIFSADSDAAIDIMRAAAGDDGIDLRWRVALWGVDKLLSDFKTDLEARRELVAKWRDGIQGQVALGKSGRLTLGARFRTERRALEEMFWRSKDLAAPFEEAWSAYDRRSSRVAVAAEELSDLAARGELRAEVRDLLASYSHMHVNRLIRSAGVAHEGVIYDFLFRLYDGRVGLRRGRGEPTLGQESSAGF